MIEPCCEEQKPWQCSQIVAMNCPYCLSAEGVSGQACHVDHVVPRVLGGETNVENLCIACATCNGTKLDRVSGIDPLTGLTIALYSPRKQLWREHFRWSVDATQKVRVSTRAFVDTAQVTQRGHICAKCKYLTQCTTCNYHSGDTLLILDRLIVSRTNVLSYSSI